MGANTPHQANVQTLWDLPGPMGGTMCYQEDPGDVDEHEGHQGPLIGGTEVRTWA